MRTFKGKLSWRRLAGAGLLVTLSSIALVQSQAQFQIDAPPAAAGSRSRPNANEDSPFSPSPRLMAKVAKMQNEQRQKRLVSDAGKLLALAHELQLEVDNSTGNTAAAVKKAEEIEKLARSVKDKMRAP